MKKIILLFCILSLLVGCGKKQEEPEVLPPQTNPEKEMLSAEAKEIIQKALGSAFEFTDLKSLTKEEKEAIIGYGFSIHKNISFVEDKMIIEEVQGQILGGDVALDENIPPIDFGNFLGGKNSDDIKEYLYGNVSSEQVKNYVASAEQYGYMKKSLHETDQKLTYEGEKNAHQLSITWENERLKIVMVKK